MKKATFARIVFAEQVEQLQWSLSGTCELGGASAPIDTPNCAPPLVMAHRATMISTIEFRSRPSKVHTRVHFHTLARQLKEVIKSIIMIVVRHTSQI